MRRGSRRTSRGATGEWAGRLPTVFLIGREGKIAEVITGSGEGDTRLEEALGRLGVKLNLLPATPAR